MTLFRLSFLFLCLPMPGQAQTAVSYEYDASGNRILRTASVPESRAAKKSGAATREQAVPASVTVSPNPTKGKLRVSIPAVSELKAYRLSVCDASGRLVLRRQAKSPVTVLDLTNRPLGIYLLHLDMDGRKETHKIIKE